jgi:L-fuculose-phosphate aldolase
MAGTRLNHAALRQAIIDTCRAMNASGINQGTSGNVSARVEGGLLITPTGVPYDVLTPDMICEMDLEGGYRGERLPSSEWRMHVDILRERPEAQAVVHAHPTYATALACLRQEVPAFHYMVAAVGGPSLRCSDYATFGTRALSEVMLAAMRDRAACLLANHGMICFGPSLDKALWLAVEIEAMCRQYAVARTLGEPVLLDADEMARVGRRFKSYGRQSHEIAPGDEPAFEMPTRRGDG